MSKHGVTAHSVRDLRVDTTYRVRFALLYASVVMSVSAHLTRRHVDCDSNPNQHMKLNYGIECATRTETVRVAREPIVLVSALLTSLMHKWTDLAASL